MLLFKKKFIEPIRRGEKTQTIRLWKRPQMRSGQRSFIPGIGYISILSVEQVELERLTDEDAVPDGFSTAEELRQEIRTLYADTSKTDRRVFRIRFSVFPADMQVKIKEEQARKKELALRDRQQEACTAVENTLEKLRRLAET